MAGVLRQQARTDLIRAVDVTLQRSALTAKKGLKMTTIQLSATPKGNGYQATVTFPDGVSMSSNETYPTIGEAIAATAIKLLDMPDHLARLDQPAG